MQTQTQIPNNFKGSALTLSAGAYGAEAARLSVEPEVVEAFTKVESRGAGFDGQGRPKILFERHRFYWLLKKHKPHLVAQAVKAGLAYPRWKRNYRGDMYGFLAQAMAIDAACALMACSWGLGQVMGENYKMLGYASVFDMVADACESEDKHLYQMMKYCEAAGVVRYMRLKNFAKMAELYNGPGYKKNKYDTKMRAEYRRLKRPNKVDPYRSIPKTELEMYQRKLKELGFHEVGLVDGKWGSRTKTAVTAFQLEHGLTANGELDDPTKEMLLETDAPRTVSEDRQKAKTVEGSRTMTLANTIKAGATTVLAGTGVSEWLDQAEGVKEQATRAWDVFQPLKSVVSANPTGTIMVFCALALAAGFAFTYFRLSDHREGKLA